MRVRFTPSGRLQFLRAVAYVHRDNPEAARKLRVRAEGALRRLGRYPKSDDARLATGPGEERGVRKLSDGLRHGPDVVAIGPEGGDDLGLQVFVGEKPHRREATTPPRPRNS